MFFCYSVSFFSDKVTKGDRCFFCYSVSFLDKVTHLFKIEMLETTVSGIMEEHHNQHHLCLRGIVESW